MGTAASGSPFEIMNEVRRMPKALSWQPACQMDTFSDFQVSTGPTVAACVGTMAMLPPPEVRAFCITVMQNARTSGGGNVTAVPTQAATVGPVETWKAEKVSIWHAGMHDNPFGMRLTALMISKQIADSAVPMSLLADHLNVHFHYYRKGLGTVEVEMH